MSLFLCRDSLYCPIDLGETLTGKIRVQASDGLHTGEDTSEGTFVTPNSPPTCNISNPANGEQFVGVQPISLEASFFDKEDDDPTSAVWQSNLSPFNLGAGEVVSRTADELAEGQHLITLTCRDSGGLIATDQVSITVNRVVQQTKGDADVDGDIDRNDLGIILQDRNKNVANSSCGSICDLNDDGVINMLDMRQAALNCTRSGCAP